MVLPTQRNPPQFAISLQQVPLAAIAAAEGIAFSSHLSLKEEIDRFHFAEQEKTPERPMELLDSNLTGFLQLISQDRPLLWLK